MTQRFFEDLTVGEVHDCGEYTLSRDEIVEFAERYDPQPFHVDEEAAGESMYGGLIASGWQTAAACMRRYVDGFLSEVASVGARGVDELRWYRPVRPEDALSIRAEVLEKGEDTRPERGLVRVRVSAENQEGEEVVSLIGLMLVERREAEAGGG